MTRLATVLLSFLLTGAAAAEGTISQWQCSNHSCTLSTRNPDRIYHVQITNVTFDAMDEIKAAQKKCAPPIGLTVGRQDMDSILNSLYICLNADR